MSEFIEITLDVSAVPEKPAGAGRYIIELARKLKAHNDVSPTLLTRRNDADRWESMSGSGDVLSIVPTKRPLRLVWEQISLPKELKSIAPQLHHGPHYTIPERARLPKIATIHDMTFFDHPEWHEPSKVPIFRRAIRRATERAAGLIAVSQDTANRLQERFGELPVTAIPLGVDHERFRRAVDWDEEKQDRTLLESHGISEPFIAFIGTIEPRKDVPTLLLAFDRIAERNPKLHLVIAGRPGWGVDAVDDVMKQMRFADRVIRTGFLPDAAIPSLLRQAKAVAYPSLAEGFGLPALEALACGAPLVTTRGSAMQEVVDDAALLIDPGDVRALEEALAELITDGGESRRLQAMGPSVAARYTWDACAEAHIEVYRKIAPQLATREY